jgi:hypothetical protein
MARDACAIGSSGSKAEGLSSHGDALAQTADIVAVSERIRDVVGGYAGLSVRLTLYVAWSPVRQERINGPSQSLPNGWQVLTMSQFFCMVVPAQ